ncbi:MAG TPA: PRC-barrel domain-containing protein [Gemmatimonadaceae bacterium]
MANTPYSLRLRYLDASDLDDSDFDFDGLDVYGWEHEKLGDLSGFIVDVDTGRVNYAVVDTGGWFRSRQLLLPIGHVTTLDRDKKELQVDLSQEALREYPEFDVDRFQHFSDDDLRGFEQRTAAVCCPDDVVPEGSWAYESRRHYREPTWWHTEWGAGREAWTEPQTWKAAPSTGAGAAAARPAERSPIDYDREHVRGSAGDVSPHHDGRAQPGDVLGVETAGERSYLGDTSEDENERREEAERANRER